MKDSNGEMMGMGDEEDQGQVQELAAEEGTTPTLTNGATVNLTVGEIPGIESLQEGDQVNITATATVSSVGGDSISVQIDSVDAGISNRADKELRGLQGK